MTDTTAYEVAHDSYQRCLRAPNFFGEFYDRLQASDPAIPPMFAETEFPRQHRLLQHGLGLLLIHAKRHDEELLDRIARRHGKGDLDVPPAMYGFFVESLIGAVSRYDPDFGTPVEQAWREALRPGIDFMKSKYDG